MKEPAAGERRRDGRWAFVAFVVIAIASVPVLLRLNDDRWFQYDEWDFLASRDGGSLRDLLEPHVVHLSALPILVYRGLWRLFGIHDYWPYQLVTIVAHLGVVFLGRSVMRRAGVRPWTATAACLPLVFFGAGGENIGWAFQITWNASLAFGLGHLLLADHDGPVDRRDALGLLAGLAGLLSSGIGVTMVVVVGLATLLRRGWRVAVLHTAPLGATYLAWHFTIGRDNYPDEGGAASGGAVSFGRAIISASFDGLAQVPGLGWLLGALVLGGTYLAWHGRPRDEVRRIAAAPAALTVGAFTSAAITALGRADRGLESAGQTRYVYVFGALLLPIVAVAADAIMRRWRLAVPVLAIALAASVIGNVRDFSDKGTYSGDFVVGYRNQLLAVPRSNLVGQVPRDVHPERGLAPNLSVGWLVDGFEAGRIPPPGQMEPGKRAAAEARLVLQPVRRHRPVDCETVTGPVEVTLQRGSSLRVPAQGRQWLVYLFDRGVEGLIPVPGGNTPVLAYAGPLDVRMSSTAPGGEIELCDLEGGPVTVPTPPL